ncbi:winged-helix domain-containing protein [Halosimplex pelagicum]|uniref:ArsR family transcriptional regulator n=1 Tax=Halosimplex pelagicum TaxID=869886 RepID=A0A7D5TCS5_9EURY|nr:winged-helix domain-containing protein [Halosimplex pelagicum]QLH83413.1 ArsR family transcriptional regulator [Halosimplex pelagicum]
MTGRDDIILEYLAETGVALNKRGLEINLQEEGYDISYSTIKRRLPKLEEADLIEIVYDAGPWYRITDRGLNYLEGNVDLREDSE